MREIKFRAWDKKNEAYLYDVQNASDMFSNVKYENGENADCDEECFAGFLYDERYDIEQYVGLHDKNGREIYESDILRVTTGEDGESYIATVKWFGDEGYPAFDLKDIPAAWNYDANALTTIFRSGVETCEVIGNIHEDKTTN